MNFDFKWFLTIPGMLITGGVLLLLIALIIFVATTGKKGKKKEEQPVSNQNEAVANQQMVMENQGMDPALAQSPVMDDQPVQPLPDINNQQPTVMPEIDAQPTVMNGNLNHVPEPVMEPVTPTILPNQPTMNNEIAMPTVEVAPTIEPPIVEATPALEPSVSIYGGADPSVSNVVINDQGGHKIYGGADPLEGTQTIPIIKDQTPMVEPTVGVRPDIIMNEPVTQAPTVTPEIQSVEPVMPMQTEIPTIQPIDPVTPIQPIAPNHQTSESITQIPVVTPDIPTIEPVGMQPEVQPTTPVTPQIVPQTNIPNMNQPLITPVHSGPVGITPEPVQATAPSVETLNQ